MSDWAHAPVHRDCGQGAYILTAATYGHQPFLDGPARKTLVLETLQELAPRYGFTLQAWAVMNNHYHVVALSQAIPDGVRKLVSHLHTLTATHFNKEDETPGRKVWYQYWETLITHDTSYFARLHYVHENPVHHGVVSQASLYRWCSAGWFEQQAPAAFRKMVMGFKIDRVNVPDNF